ncbi:MAG: lipopolysaccharide biosynthesis protein [Geminicoccaceae bacterium]
MPRYRLAGQSSRDLFAGLRLKQRFDRFTRQSMLLSGGSVVAQAIIVAGSPILTRLYSPEDFGVFAVLTAWISIVGPVACLGLETPILVEQDDRRACSLTLAALISALGTTALLVAVVALLARSGWPSAVWGRADALVWLIPFGVLLYSLAQPLANLALRGGAVIANSLTQVLQAICQLAAQVALGISGTGLAIGYVVGLTPRLLWLGRVVQPALRRHLQELDPQELTAAFRREWRYPLIAVPSTLLRLGSQFLPVVIVTLLYGPGIGGLFGLAQRVVTMPVRMIGLATSQAFLAEARTLDRAGLRRLLAATVLRFFVIGLAWGMPLALVAPYLFAFVFGSEWRMAGEITRVLIPIHIARFVLTPISQALNIVGRQELDLALALPLIVALGLSFALAHAADLPPLSAVLAYSVASCGVFIATIWVSWRAMQPE